jgi:hypothetical protein
MNYLNFKTEYLELCQKFGRNTNRKIINDLNKDIAEFEYRIDAIKDKINLNGFAYLYGEVQTKKTLLTYVRELELTNILKTELTTKNN